MIRKNYMLILTIILTLTYTVGCSQNNQTTPSSTNAFPPEETKAAVTTIQEARSPDGKYTAYIASKAGINRLFLGEGTDFQKAKEIYLETSVKEIKWSPNSKFVFAGDTTRGKGVIYSVEESKPLLSWRFKTGPYWSPEGDKLAYTRFNEVWSDQKKHSIISYDLVVDDLAGNMYTGPEIFARGTEDYYYNVKGWGNDGEIKYERISLRDNQLLENLSNQYAHNLWAINSLNGERHRLGTIPDLEYRYFDLSPDRKWLSMVKVTFSGGEAEGGIPHFYNLQTGELRSLEKEFNTWFWNPQWFKDSSRILLNETTLYDIATNQILQYKLPEEIVTLGAKPSPDGQKLAVFGCDKDLQTASTEGKKLTVYLLDREGKLLNSYQTPLYPDHSGNLLMSLPVNFDWLPDNKTLIIEAWNQQNRNTTLQKLDLTNGTLTELAKNTFIPAVSPDGEKIAVITTEKPQEPGQYKLKVLNIRGETLNTFEIMGGHKILWSNDSETIVIMGYSGYQQKFLMNFNIVTNKYNTLEVEQSLFPLSIDQGEIISISRPSS